jgi:hypothetical protein
VSEPFVGGFESIGLPKRTLNNEQLSRIKRCATIGCGGYHAILQIKLFVSMNQLRMNNLLIASKDGHQLELHPGFPTVRGDWRLSGPQIGVPSGAWISDAWSVPGEMFKDQGPV